MPDNIFDNVFNLVMNHEGYYSNDPVDRGGETYRGISRKHHPNWNGWLIIDELKNDENFYQLLKSSDVLEESVKSFYKDHYWNRFWGDDVTDYFIALELFDISVNMGVARAVEFLQITLNKLNRNGTLYDDIAEDGIFGPKTLRAIKIYLETDNSDLLVKIMNTLQGYHYIQLMTKSPDQEKFVRGWFKRVNFSR
jgi:lysozyme family protein